VTVPRRRLWRIFFWIVAIALVIEALGLTSTFIELRRQRLGISGGLVADQIAAVVHLWPSLNEDQRRDVLTAMSSAGLRYRVVSEGPVKTPENAYVREVEEAVRKRLASKEQDHVVAFIRARPFGREHRAINWSLSTEPIQVYVRLTNSQWLAAEVRGELLPRFFGLPTGFWLGIIGILPTSVVLLVILREGRAVERIAHSVEAFASTGVPQPLLIRGSPAIAGLAKRTLRMQEQVATLLHERNIILGAIAHDIKTYVQRLKLRLEVLDDPDQLRKASLDLDAMDKLVEDALLVAVHANPLKATQPVEIRSLVADEVEAARMAGGKITFDAGQGTPFFICGERTALSRALTNIIGNALRYGHVAHVSTCQTNDAVQIIVDDEGSGIPRSQRKSIFRAFQRGESSRNRSTGGTGLGLAIALGIIERQHHGSIEIGDAPSGGARVTIRLPCWQS
jgi:two-component system, OmpR family, osmolarity sensor histidine kinase EnvZ